MNTALPDPCKSMYCMHAYACAVAQHAALRVCAVAAAGAACDGHGE